MKPTTIPLVTILAVLLLILSACAGCMNAPATKTAATVTVSPVSGTVTPGPPAPVPAGSCTPITLTQSDGTEVTLPCIPQRIIVTNSDAAEMLLALGAADRIVGITESTRNVSYIMDRIPAAQSIGDWQTPNIERMLALKPDVVISYASSKPKNLEQIRAANITVIYLDCYRLPKIASDARAVGILTGHEDRAEAYVRMVGNVTSMVGNRVAGLGPAQQPAVYFEGYSDYTAAGPGSGSDELLTMAGGRNIAKNLSSSSPKVSAEWVVSQKPAYLMKVVSSRETRPFSEIAERMKDRAGWSTIPAVENDRIAIFSSSVEYGPKSYIGLASTAKILHPDLFADISPGTLLDDYAAQFIAGTNTSRLVFSPMV